jgi:hypothetical protein
MTPESPSKLTLKGRALELVVISTLALVVCLFSTVETSAQETASQAQKAKWILVWSDEFNGPNGSGVDGSKWTLEVNGDGGGNHELQYYTNRPQNVHIQDGNLMIEVRQEKYTGADRVTRNYTSARLETAGKFSQIYGRFEARIKIPFGQGLWPAFWMLGDDIGKAGWPDCGEIDIMENIGKEPRRSMDRSMDLDLPVPMDLRRATHCRESGGWPMISIFSPLSGSQTRFASTSTTSFTSLALDRISGRVGNGSSITLFSSCSTSRSEATGQEVQTQLLFFRKLCWWTTCECTNDPATRIRSLRFHESWLSFFINLMEPVNYE